MSRHGRPIAFQSIGVDHSGHIGEPLKQFAEECLGGFLVAPTLPQDIAHVAILIHGPPQIVTSALDREKDFIQVPRVPRSGTAAPQLIGMGLPECPAPIPHGFIGQADTAFYHQLLDISIAQAEAKVEPDTMVYDLSRGPMPRIRVGCR
jgi:hypothetical protein